MTPTISALGMPLHLLAQPAPKAPQQAAMTVGASLPTGDVAGGVPKWAWGVGAIAVLGGGAFVAAKVIKKHRRA